jgi:prophage antirepressor-like protein
VTTAVEVFQFPATAQQVRAVVRDGEPWFVAGDVCAELGHRMPSDALRWLEDAEKGYAVVRTPGGDQRVSIVSESGLYALIFRSKNPAAKQFRIWVTSEVLPAIRKTGGYSVAVPRTLPEALRAYAAEVESHEATRAELAVAEPKAEAWDTLASADGDFSVRQAAYILNRDPAIDTGQKRLFALLRDFGLIDGRDIPYASHAKHVRLRATSYEHPHTREQVGSTQVRITADGVRYLHKRMGGIRQPAFADLDRTALERKAS